MCYFKTALNNENLKSDKIPFNWNNSSTAQESAIQTSVPLKTQLEVEANTLETKDINMFGDNFNNCDDMFGT